MVDDSRLISTLTLWNVTKTNINYINESNTMYHPKLDAAHHQS